MRYLRPSWIVHKDDKSPNPGTIFSLDIQPNAQRLATGGLDGKVRLWSTNEFFDPDLDLKNIDNREDSNNTRLLSTAIAHNGTVLAVRWDPNGQRFASGSDDTVVFVWELDNSSGLGKIWGTDDVNVENWRATRRLAGHGSDVTCLAWSHDGDYLASAGLDKLIVIWDSATFNVVAKLDLHVGFIKGISFDPVGQYLASQSDDKSVKIWRTTDWELEKDITEPFQQAPTAAFFMRLDWSPDGNFLVTPNSSNGPVFVSSVIDRNQFQSNTSLVGHDYITQVVAFSPNIYLRDAKGPATGPNFCSVVALAARNSVSVWSTNRTTPICVANDVLDRDVLDMSWSRDGLNLFVSSSDGHVCILSFKSSELPAVAPPETRQKYYASTFKFNKPQRQRIDHQVPEHGPGSLSNPNVLNVRRDRRQAPSPPISREQKVTIVNGKRRIQPAFLGSIPSGPITSSAFDVPNSQQPQQQQQQQLQTTFPPPSQHPPQQLLQSDQHMSALDARMVPDRLKYPNTTSSIHLNEFQGQPSRNYGLGRRVGDEELPPEPEPEPIVFDIRPSYAYSPPPKAGPNGETLQLSVPEVKSYGFVTANDDSEQKLEWRNYEDANKLSQVWLKNSWIDYVHSYIVTATVTPYFSAISLEDGSLIIYSPTGKRITSPLLLEAPLSFTDSAEFSLMAITARAKLYMWDIKTRSIVFDPISVLDLISESPATKHTPTIVSAQCRPNAKPIICLSNGSVYTFDSNMRAWSLISSGLWAKESDFWEGRMRSSSVDSARGVIRRIEGFVNDMVAADPEIGDKSSQDHSSNVMEVDGPHPPSSLLSNSNTHATTNGTSGKDRTSSHTDEIDQKIAISLSHLQSRMAAAINLESANEYKKYLSQYARKLSDEGFKARAEELLKELLGPIYHKPGRKEVWSPTLVGLQKRDLLKEVLQIFSKNPIFTQMTSTYKELLSKISEPSNDYF